MGLGKSLIGAALLAVVLVSVLIWPRRHRGRSRAVQVLVLGDVGRSPRMQYHALSIAQHAPVQLIGYFDSDLLDALADHPRLTRVPLTPAPTALRRLPFVVGGPLKVVWQVLNLAFVLAYTTSPARWLLVQNPPSIPTLALAALVGRMRNTRLLVDWHNYGWTILAGSRAGAAGTHHPLVRLARRYEEVCGRLGHANLTVSRAMAAQLRAAPYRLRAPIAVLHDRPAALFQPAPLPFPPANRARTLATILKDPSIESLVAVRGARILVSSTSWTPDEDFQLLLDALVQYAVSGPPPPAPVLAIITGKGPQKALYTAKIAALAAAGQLPPDRVTVRTAFLPMRDYASLLALADLGVCLHMSSSGVDLPMKVVDMFGAGLPVVAYAAYESFGELVHDGANGRGFTAGPELAGLLTRLLGPAGADELARLRSGARQESQLRWADEWDRVVAPILGLAVEEKKTA